jgi:hypothetical protein
MNPVTVITDKVMRMGRSMVYLAMRVYPGSSVSPAEISHYIEQNTALVGFHAGAVELALRELYSEGLVQRSGSRWSLAGS